MGLLSLMRLLCRQENDGVQSGGVFVIETFGDTPEEYLARKERSHRNGGWHIEHRPDGVLHAWKTYPASGRRRDPNAILRKDRYMWLEE